MSDKDLIILDEEYISAEKYLMFYLQSLIDAANEYNSILSSVRQYAAKTSTNFAGLMSEMNLIKKNIEVTKNILKGKNKEFIGKVESIDHFKI